MVGLLETTFTLSLPSGSPPFKFLRGRSPHRVFCLNRERLALGHKPLIFYAFTWLASQGGCIMLYLAGFRYFGQRTTVRLASLLSRFSLADHLVLQWPLPLYCSSPSSLESVHDAHEHSKMRSSTQLSSRTSYWFKPARGLAQEEDQRPLIFCHGISGTYGPSCFVAAIAYLTGMMLSLLRSSCEALIDPALCRSSNLHPDPSLPYYATRFTLLHTHSIRIYRIDSTNALATWIWIDLPRSR